MVVNRLIKDVLQEQDKSIVYIANRTGYTLERLDEIVNCNSAVTPVEAHNILDVLGVSLSDVICTI